MLCVVDSYAWAEYFIGSPKGEILKKILKDPNSKLITPECCMAEIAGWALKNRQDFDKIFAAIRANSEIVEVTVHEWIQAGGIRFRMRKKIKDFGLIDSVILVKQKEFNAKIVSGDRHFMKMPGVIFMR